MLHILSPLKFSVFVLPISSHMIVGNNLKVMGIYFGSQTVVGNNSKVLGIYFGSWPFGWI